MRNYFCLFLVMLTAALRAETPAIMPGEKLVYKVGWAIFGGAGEIKLTAADSLFSDGRRGIEITMTTSTRGIARAIYPFDARAVSLFDASSGMLLATTETSRQPDRQTGDSVKFDYQNRMADYQNPFRPDSSRLIPIPAGNPLDLIQSLIQARKWNLRPGEQRDALVIFGDEFYLLTLHAESIEDVSVPLGNYRAVLIVPKMEKTPPQGMFKRGSTVRVWISDDEQRLPVKFQVELKFGTGVAALTHYDPPPKSPAGKVADAKNPRS